MPETSGVQTDAGAEPATTPATGLRLPALERLTGAFRRAAFPADSPIRTRLTRGAFWSVIDTGFNRGFALIISIVVARTVGRELFGEFGVVQSTIGIFGLFAGMGMSVTATRYVAELRHTDPARTGRVLGLAFLMAAIGSSVMTTVLVVTAPWLARNTLASTEVGWLLRLGCGLLLFGVLNGAVVGALYGFERFKDVALVDGLAGALGCAAVIFGARNYGVAGAVVGLVLGMSLQCLGYSIFLRRALRGSGLRIVYAGALAEWPVLMKFSVPALLAVAMTGPVTWLCSAIVVNQPGGYGELGLFNAANQWRGVIMLLPVTLSVPFLPVLTSLFGKDPRKYLKVLKTAVGINSGVALLAGATIIALSRPILSTYGKSFTEGTSVLLWLVLSGVLSAAVWSVGQAITSSGKMWWGFAINVIWAAVLVASVWVLRDKGAYGYAVANFIAYSVHLVTSLVVYRRVHPGTDALPAER
jgi:O-antigen/teichoic acid export membrane protein